MDNIEGLWETEFQNGPPRLPALIPGTVRVIRYHTSEALNECDGNIINLPLLASQPNPFISFSQTQHTMLQVHAESDLKFQLIYITIN